MSTNQELHNKAVTEFVGTIQDKLSGYLRDKINYDKFNELNFSTDDYDSAPASMISLNYLKIFYSYIKGSNNIYGFKLEDIKEEDIINYFFLSDDLYPVFYFETFLDKSSQYSINSETSYVFVYNNGSILTVKDIKNGLIQTKNELEQTERLKFLHDNAKGVVTNKILKFIYSCFGIVSKINICKYCKSMYNLEQNKGSLVYTDYINADILKNKGYSYELCEKQRNRTGNCNLNYSYVFTKDTNPLVIVNDTFYDYIIREHIVRKDIMGNIVNSSVIENIINEMIKGDYDRKLSKIKEINDSLKLQLYRERESFEEYKREELEKLNHEINYIYSLKKDIEYEHTETLRYKKLKLEEEIRKEISTEYKERREMENKMFIQEMESEIKSRSINYAKSIFNIENEDELRCLKILYENIKSESVHERKSNIEYIIETVITSYDDSERKDYIYKGKIFKECCSTLEVLAKYNKTTVKDYIRSYIKDYTDTYLQILVSYDSESTEFIRLLNELRKITSDVYEYVQDEIN